nr:glycine cleavage system aminomethyltransferase GcvT [Ardenticatena sp.]
MNNETLRRTPLYATHLAMGARMVPFGGWEMPVQYSSIIEEHLAVRRAAGLFDVSHMGEFEIKGPNARHAVQYLTANDVEKLSPGKAQYSMFLNESGGTVDDIIVYELAHDHYLVVVNAANIEKDWAHVQQVLADFEGVEARNRSDDFALLAFQGPKAATLLQRLTDANLDEVKFYHHTRATVAGHDVMLARTGYTGEDGFELFVTPDEAADLWNALLDAGRDEGVLPAGLGARDTLRLEASLPLYGHELDEETSPLEAGLGRFVAKEGEYVGAEATRRLRETGLRKKLVMLEMRGRGIPRQGYPVHVDGEAVGVVTSGSYAPFLEKNIAMAFVRPDSAEIGRQVEVLIRNRPVPAEIVKRPFYKRA